MNKVHALLTAGQRSCKLVALLLVPTLTLVALPEQLACIVSHAANRTPLWVLSHRAFCLLGVSRCWPAGVAICVHTFLELGSQYKIALFSGLTGVHSALL
jgi:hypothetical protein